MATINQNEILNEINTPLRFYNSILKKDRFKYPRRNDDPFRLLSPQHCLLPFQIATDPFPNMTVLLFEVVSDSGVRTSLNINLIEFYGALLGKNYYSYLGGDHGQTFDCGFYTVEITFSNGIKYFSEDFYIIKSGYCGNYAVNGHFLSDLSGWNIVGNITWVNGRAHFAVGGSTKQLSQTPAVSGKIRLTFTINNYTGSGTAPVLINGVVAGQITGNGTYSFYGDLSGGLIYIQAASTRGFDVDEVEIAKLSSDAMDCNIMMEWKSECDFGNQFYGTGFFNRFIFPDDIDLYEPKWKISLQGTKNGNDGDIPTFKKRQKIYHIELVAPEYVVDALVEMSIHPDKTFVMKRCFGRARMYDVSVTSKPVLDGLFQVEIDFSLDEVVETGCCAALETCLEACQVDVRGVPTSDCLNGAFYIAPDKSYYTCNFGTLEATPCESGLMNQHSSGEAAYWLWNDITGEWENAPEIFDIELISGNAYKIYARIIPFTMGQLSYSLDGGAHYQNFANGIFSAADWLNGIEFTLDETTEYLFKISSGSGACSYAASESLSYTTGDTDNLSENWVAPYYHSMWRAPFDVDTEIDATVSSILCNGVEQLLSPLTFTINQANATYALGVDGNLYLTSFMDEVNAVLPSGYEIIDDFRVIRFPTGESFHFEIHIDYVDPPTTASNDYTYDNLTGFIY